MKHEPLNEFEKLLISTYLDDELSPAEREQIERRLADSEEAASFFESLVRQRDAIRSLKTATPAIDLADRLLASLDLKGQDEGRSLGRHAGRAATRLAAGISDPGPTESAAVRHDTVIPSLRGRRLARGLALAACLALFAVAFRSMLVGRSGAELIAGRHAFPSDAVAQRPEFSEDRESQDENERSEGRARLVVPHSTLPDENKALVEQRAATTPSSPERNQGDRASHFEAGQEIADARTLRSGRDGKIESQESRTDVAASKDFASENVRVEDARSKDADSENLKSENLKSDSESYRRDLGPAPGRTAPKERVDEMALGFEAATGDIIAQLGAPLRKVPGESGDVPSEMRPMGPVEGEPVSPNGENFAQGAAGDGAAPPIGWRNLTFEQKLAIGSPDAAAAGHDFDNEPIEMDVALPAKELGRTEAALEDWLTRQKGLARYGATASPAARPPDSEKGLKERAEAEGVHSKQTLDRDVLPSEGAQVAHAGADLAEAVTEGTSEQPALRGRPPEGDAAQAAPPKEAPPLPQADGTVIRADDVPILRTELRFSEPAADRFADRPPSADAILVVEAPPHDAQVGGGSRILLRMRESQWRELYAEMRRATPDVGALALNVQGIRLEGPLAMEALLGREPIALSPAGEDRLIGVLALGEFASDHERQQRVLQADAGLPASDATLCESPASTSPSHPVSRTAPSSVPEAPPSPNQERAGLKKAAPSASPLENEIVDAVQKTDPAAGEILRKLMIAFTGKQGDQAADAAEGKRENPSAEAAGAEPLGVEPLSFVDRRLKSLRPADKPVQELEKAALNGNSNDGPDDKASTSAADSSADIVLDELLQLFSAKPSAPSASAAKLGKETSPTHSAGKAPPTVADDAMGHKIEDQAVNEFFKGFDVLRSSTEGGQENAKNPDRWLTIVLHFRPIDAEKPQGGETASETAKP